MRLGDLKRVHLDVLEPRHETVAHRLFETQHGLTNRECFARARHTAHVHAAARLILQIRLDEIVNVGELLLATRQTIGRVRHVQLHARLFVHRQLAVLGDLRVDALLRRRGCRADRVAAHQ